MITRLLLGVRKFEKESHEILSAHEGAPKSRTLILEETYSRLSGLSLRQDDQFRQSLRCIENGLYRASHVMAWSAFIDFVQEKLGEDGYSRLRSTVKNCTVASSDDLREKYNDHMVIQMVHDVGLVGKTEMKAYHGLLNKRNECAHPSDFYPDHNESLGYVSEPIARLESLQKRRII